MSYPQYAVSDDLSVIEAVRDSQHHLAAFARKARLWAVARGGSPMLARVGCCVSVVGLERRPPSTFGVWTKGRLAWRPMLGNAIEHAVMAALTVELPAIPGLCPQILPKGGGRAMNCVPFLHDGKAWMLLPHKPAQYTVIGPQWQAASQEDAAGAVASHRYRAGHDAC